MKTLYCLLLTSIMSSCWLFSAKNEKIAILNKYSRIEFPDSTVYIIKFSKIGSGIFKKEVAINALYGLKKNLDLETLKEELIHLGYKKLPISINDAIVGDEFNEHLNKSDKGFYKINFNYKRGTQEWIIINFSQRIIILEANL